MKQEATATAAELWERIRQARRTVIFTGAGISTLSGIPDFRGAHGVYRQDFHGLPVEEILSVDCFLRHPEYFYEWARTFVYNLDRYQPNVVHRAAAELVKRGLARRVYTQNIDILHQKAGCPDVGELHGSPAMHHCLDCGQTSSYDEIAPLVQRGEVPRCKVCGGLVKPDIVFYGESLDEQLLSQAFDDFEHADLALVLGSSLTVQPAASLPEATVRTGGKVVIVNATPTPLDRYAVMKCDDLAAPFEELEKLLAAGC